jgi:non-ribosomal peptide synthetase component F
MTATGTMTDATSAAAQEAFVFPVSFGQRRLWFLHQFGPDSPAYNIPIAMRMRRPVTRSALERAVNELVRRHEILRTTFRVIDGEPMQVIAPSLSLPVAYSDLGATAEDQKEAAAGNLAFLDATCPFRLSEGPLIRVGLHRLRDTDHLLLISMHHIVSDGWSIGVLFRELNALYSAFSTGRSSPLPALRVQYADFAQWQRQALTGQTLDKLLGYWKQRLAGAPESLALPSDRGRPPVASGRGGAHGAVVGASLYQGVRTLARRERATPFMVLLALFQVLLFRHTGETDQVLGTPIANRTKPQLEELIGLFVNTLVIRNDLAGDPAFLALLGRVRETVLGAFAHQDMPFELLVEELQPTRTLNHNPLFQVMFLLQSAEPSAARERDAGGARSVHVATTSAKFDLTVSVVETGPTVNIGVEYNVDLFNIDTVKLLIDRFIVLIESAVAEPRARLSELRLCSPAELRAIQPIDGPAPVPAADASLWSCVECWAEAFPDRMAVATGEHAISYRDLALRAIARADELSALDVRTGDPVPLRLDFDIGMITTILAASRIDATLVACAPTADGDFSPGLAAEPGGSVACILEIPTPDGRPRGVRVPPAALKRTDFGHGLRISENDRVVLCTSTDGEFAIFEACAALAAGAELALTTRQPAPRALATLLRDHRATFAIAPLDTLDRIAREFPWALRDLRVAVAHAGALAHPPVQESLRQKLLIVDGCAEAGGYAFVAPAARAAPGTIGSVAVGLTVHLLDGALRPVPDGMVGEVFLEGRFLASGYDDAATTAHAFHGERHRTGMLARRGPSGELTACGRRDRRLRVRDVRVELEAIEAALRREPRIAQVALVRGGDGALSAWLVPADGIPLGPEDLAALCRDRMPPAAVPSTWRLVDDLPRASDGRIDLAALQRRELELASGGAAPEHVAPRDAIEARLAQLWAHLLRVTRIGVRDNFFQLGGHSLLATRMVAQIADDFGVAVTLRDFFAAPTIEGLAALVARQPAGTAVTPPAIVPIATDAATEMPDVAQLTDEDVDAMLATLLNEPSGPRTEAP